MFALLLISAPLASATRQTIPFSSDWRFLRDDVSEAESKTFSDQNWESVTLPHTARIEALVAGKKAPQWQGVCWYRKTFELPTEARGREVILRFEGAMNIAEVWVNGRPVGNFMGGYLPYVMDISDTVVAGETNVVAVRLDNRDNPITGPKPLADLDFNLYGGLYRDATLTIRDRLHITDSILADKPASGGVFVTFPVVSKTSATVNVRTHVKNDHSAARDFILRTTLLAANGAVAAPAIDTSATLQPASDRQLIQEIQIVSPKLWSPQTPNLYQVRTEILRDGEVVDSAQTRIGIRRIEITKDGFWINGEKMFLRGVNRHQEYPYLGNALSDAAQFRDARKIKEAGFDYIRLSHYPQSPAFLDACDELGIVVMDCLMGWQYFNREPAFSKLKIQECRQLIRRDRNHPSVILWETSLNESEMPKSFVEQAHAAAHEEYPGDQCFTCGWTKGFDVFIQARQHGGCTKITDLPCVVSEYGDWEYFAQNAGLAQELWKDLQPAERNSRQFRGDGEVRMLQQAKNFQEAHNDNLKTRAFADGLWVMFDYNRGYADDIEASGVMDIFRLPKFSYWFFRSQRSPGELTSNGAVQPMVFIANYWTSESPRDVRVFSNCEEVSLYLNGKLIERRRPDADRISSKLKHPPFDFEIAEFKPGKLEAVGYVNGKEVARSVRLTPKAPQELTLQFDTEEKPFGAEGKDAVFCRAEVRDVDGTIVPSQSNVSYGITGTAQLVGQNPIPAEAGIASILLQCDSPNPSCIVYALSLVPAGGSTRILAVAASSSGNAIPQFKVHYTTDGTEPTSASDRYQKPLPEIANVKAAIFVNGKIVAKIQSGETDRLSAAR